MFGKLTRKEKTEAGLEKSRRGWFGRVMSLLSGSCLNEATWEELEEVLIAADVGFTTAIDLVARVRSRMGEKHLSEPSVALAFLKEEMVHLLQPQEDKGSESPEVALSGPLVILVVGVNGTGKTTSIAKLAYHFRSDGKHVVIAAADTFRAAAVEQLQVWGQRLGIEVVSHQSGSDPGAVAYDAYEAAVARGADILLVDTAGRLHTAHNLMNELRKIRRVLTRLNEMAPHEVILVLDATTGHNGLSQACHFTEAVGCHGIFLSKLDGTAKGGIVVAIAQELHLPVRFIGTGEGLEDMSLFDPHDFVEALFTPTTGAGVAEVAP